MVKVNFYYQTNNIVSVKIEGHSNFDQYGKDIVCAGISAIVIGTLNALDHLIIQEDINIKQTDGNIIISVLNPNNNSQMILKTMFYQLKTISDQYKENINVKEVY